MEKVIDVRNDRQAEIETIIFGDGTGDYVGQLRLICKDIYLEGLDDDGDSFITLDDIDNMILALKKAKEIWGYKND